MATQPDRNNYLRGSAAETGWHSVLDTSTDEFNRFFDADGEEAFLPRCVH